MLIIKKVCCPVAKNSTTVVEMSDKLIADIAGSVTERQEWAIWLTGEITENGRYRIIDFIVPKQDRSGANVEIKEDVPEGKNIIGVMHSHSSMGAFFSGVDTAELNPLYPLSIVVATRGSNRRDKPVNIPTYERDVDLFGFNYLGVASITLPCGETGEAGVRIIPYSADDGILFDGWDDKVFIKEEPKGTVIKDLAGCVRYNECDVDENFQYTHEAECGLVGEPIKATYLFGESDQLLSQLPKEKRLTVIPMNGIISLPQTTPMSQTEYDRQVSEKQKILMNEYYASKEREAIADHSDKAAPYRLLYEFLAKGLNGSNLKNCRVPTLKELEGEWDDAKAKKHIAEFQKLFNIFRGNKKLLQEEEGIYLRILFGLFFDTSLETNSIHDELKEKSAANNFTTVLYERLNLE